MDTLKQIQQKWVICASIHDKTRTEQPERKCERRFIFQVGVNCLIYPRWIENYFGFIQLLGVFSFFFFVQPELLIFIWLSIGHPNGQTMSDRFVEFIFVKSKKQFTRQTNCSEFFSIYFLTTMLSLRNDRDFFVCVSGFEGKSVTENAEYFQLYSFLKYI